MFTKYRTSIRSYQGIIGLSSYSYKTLSMNEHVTFSLARGLQTQWSLVRYCYWTGYEHVPRYLHVDHCNRKCLIVHHSANQGFLRRLLYLRSGQQLCLIQTPAGAGERPSSMNLLRSEGRAAISSHCLVTYALPLKHAFGCLFGLKSWVKKESADTSERYQREAHLSAHVDVIT